MDIAKTVLKFTIAFILAHAIFWHFVLAKDCKNCEITHTPQCNPANAYALGGTMPGHCNKLIQIGDKQ